MDKTVISPEPCSLTRPSISNLTPYWKVEYLS